jgi:hypothetical protein
VQTVTVKSEVCGKVADALWDKVWGETYLEIDDYVQALVIPEVRFLVEDEVGFKVSRVVKSLIRDL